MLKANISFSFETSDGFRHEQRGKSVPQPGTDDEDLEVEGSYSYIGPDGKTYTVQYTAGKNGFEPQGAHLPPSAGIKPLGVDPKCVQTLCGTIG
ncbi:hypothetical protein NQ318_001057 [Aromia moschata]|uniref:Uncharacterized protein n=1 Tax=Aromia moschata TaxID=1265417 RepID=A0AAV8ZET3_9CUCU|nr:hypothetical protein NQ318_001057 [Aromia moschata]